MKVKSGDEAAVCLKLTANIDLAGQTSMLKLKSMLNELHVHFFLSS